MQEQDQTKRRKIIYYIPDIEFDELNYILRLVNSMEDSVMEQFLMVYSTKRKKAINILLLSLLGFFGIAGAQRVYSEQIGMAVLYFFTLGLCYIGTIVDLISYKKLAFEANIKIAQETAMLVVPI